MPELIDKKRTEAKVFLTARLFIDRPDREVELVKAVIHKCCEEIDKQPTIKPEVRRGRWIPIEYDSYADGAPVWDKWECSGCGHEHKGEEDTLTAFCPDCGADMRGGVTMAERKKVPLCKECKCFTPLACSKKNGFCHKGEIRERIVRAYDGQPQKCRMVNENV